MKGILKKIDGKWMVQYLGHPVGVLNGEESLVNYVQLHPDDVKQIEEDGKVFDNIEARINAYPDVEFKIITKLVWDKSIHSSIEVPYYAKLKP